MTSTSRALQCGQAGSVSRADSGLLFWRRGGKPLFLQAAQHAERAGVDRAGLGAPSPGVPALPVEIHARGFRLHLLFEADLELGRAHAELALVLERCGVSI